MVLLQMSDLKVIQRYQCGQEGEVFLQAATMGQYVLAYSTKGILYIFQTDSGSLISMLHLEKMEAQGLLVSRAKALLLFSETKLLRLQ